MANLYPSPSLTENTLTLPNSVVGPRHEANHLNLRSYGPFHMVEYFSNEVALLAYVNQNILYAEKINRVMTSEGVKDPDCECIFSSAVRLWWLTERKKPGRRSWGSVFQSSRKSHNKLSSTRCCPFFSLSNRCGYCMLFFHRRIFPQSLWSRSIRCTASFRIYILTTSRLKTPERILLTQQTPQWTHHSISWMT